MPDAQSEDRMARTLAQSLESTSLGLEAFVKSVQTFKEALHPYQQMQMVLVQQRLWSRQHARKDLDPLWQRIAASSRELHVVFSGFAGMMDLLRSIHTLEQPAPAPPKAPLMDAALADWLEAALAGFALTPVRLAGLKPKRKTGAYLKKLEQEGLLERYGRGSYRLTAEARRKLAASLVESSNGKPASA